MKQETQCFAQLENNLEVLFKVFDSNEDGVALVMPGRILFFTYAEIKRIVVRERLI